MTMRELQQQRTTTVARNKYYYIIRTVKLTSVRGVGGDGDGSYDYNAMMGDIRPKSYTFAAQR